MRLRIRKRHRELIPWLILAIGLVAVIGAAITVLMLDTQRVVYDDSNKTIWCGTCGKWHPHHMHQGIDKRHYEDY